jgi:hypothetical protein
MVEKRNGRGSCARRSGDNRRRQNVMRRLFERRRKLQGFLWNDARSGLDSDYGLRWPESSL